MPERLLLFSSDELKSSDCNSKALFPTLTCVVNPKASPLYQCVKTHFAEFEASYPTRYQERYGFYRPVIGRVVVTFLGRADLTKGFARVRCDACRHEYLLAFSCEGRYFCPSCHPLSPPITFPST